MFLVERWNQMKKLVSFILAMALTVTCTIPVLAAETDGAISQNNSVIYQNNGYTAEKISHPDTPTMSVDGIIDYNGSADRGQSYSWSAIGYGDYMYVGTCFGAIYQTVQNLAYRSGTDFSVYKAGLNALFNGKLYLGDEGQETTANRSVLVKINTKTGEVTIVQEPSTVGGYRAAIEFHDKLLKHKLSAMVNKLAKQAGLPLESVVWQL